MPLKIRIALCLTLKIKKNQRPRILVYTPSWSLNQPYSSLNSAKLSWKSEVTLVHLTESTGCFIYLSFNNTILVTSQYQDDRKEEGSSVQSTNPTYSWHSINLNQFWVNLGNSGYSQDLMSTKTNYYQSNSFLLNNRLYRARTATSL